MTRISKILLLFVYALSMPQLLYSMNQGYTYGEWPYAKSLQYRPLAMPHGPILMQKRAESTQSNYSPKNVLRIFPSTTLVHTASIGERSGVCFHDAMRRTLGLTNEQFKELEKSMVGAQDWVQIMQMPYDFFDQINQQKLGCLATYTSKGNLAEINHFGVVIAKNRIKSKFTTSNYTYDHDLWNLPDSWGDRVCFWELKQEYRNPEGKLILFFILKQRIQHPLMKARLHDYQQDLFTSHDHQRHYEILRGVMGININERNDDGKTALMLAAERGDFFLVKLHTEHHANLNLQDNNGDTALDLAADNNHQSIVEFLLEHGANPKSYKKYFRCGLMVTLGTLLVGYCTYKCIIDK